MIEFSPETQLFEITKWYSNVWSVLKSKQYNRAKGYATDWIRKNPRNKAMNGLIPKYSNTK